MLLKTTILTSTLMNKIEERIKIAFDEQYQKYRHTPTYKELAQVAASIVLEVAEKAWGDGHDNGYVAGLEGPEGTFEDFKRDLLGG